MTKEQFELFAESLYERGYKKYVQHWHHEDYVIAKGFHKKDNQWEEGRNAYYIGLSVYDNSLRKDLWDRLPAEERTHVGIEVHVDVSRTVNERIELHMPWEDNTIVTELEDQAEAFYNFVKDMWISPIKR